MMAGVRGMAVLLAAVSCTTENKGPGFSVARDSSLFAALYEGTLGEPGAVPAGSGCPRIPVDFQRLQEPAGSAASVREIARRELSRMGFSSCIRMTSRTVERDTVLRHDQVTELIAWREGEDPGLLHMPVWYRVPVGGHSRPEEWAIRPLATVLAAVCAFVSDTACAQREPAAGARPRKGLMLSFTNVAEWDGFLKSAELQGDDADSYDGNTVLTASGVGPQPPRWAVSETGWMVGQLPPHAANTRDIASSLYDVTPELPKCGSGRSCEVILPGIPPMHVHSTFPSGSDVAGVGDTRLAGERTLAVLRTADTVPYGTALPSDPQLLLWWLVPGIILLAIVYCACNSILGPVVAATRIARWGEWRARMRRLCAGVWHLAWMIALKVVRRLAANAGDRNQGTQEIDATLQGLEDEFANEVRDWLKDVKKWRDSRKIVFPEVQALCERFEGMHKWSSHKDAHRKDSPPATELCNDCTNAVGHSSTIGGAPCSASVKRQHDELREWVAVRRGRHQREKKEIGNHEGDLAEAAYVLVQQGVHLMADARRLGRRADRFGTAAGKRAVGTEATADVRGSAGSLEAVAPLSGDLDAMRHLGKALKVAGKSVGRDARTLQASVRELSFAKRGLLHRIDGAGWMVVRGALGRLISSLREREVQKEKYIAATFNSFTRVLVGFATLSWLRRDMTSRTLAVLVAVGLVALTVWRLWGPAWAVFAFVLALGVTTYFASCRRLERGDYVEPLGPAALVACGLAVVVAVVHAFVVRIDDDTLNVVLFNVHEDVWALVYGGLSAIIFLVSALGDRGFSICDATSKSLDHLTRKTPETTDPDTHPESTDADTHAMRDKILRRLRCFSIGAVGLYVALLLAVAVVAMDMGSWLDTLHYSMVRLRDESHGILMAPNQLWLVLLLSLFLLPAVQVLAHRPSKPGKEDRA